MSRRRRVHDPRALLGSVGVHAVAVIVAVASSFVRPEPLDFVTYEIELVSPAPPAVAPEEQEAREELVVERPEPTPPPPVERDEAPVEVKRPEPPKPEPPKPQPERKPTPPKPEETKAPATRPDTPAEERPRETGENINVRMEGLQRDYPAYYDNIIRQMHRCFLWRGRDDLAVEVYFVIRRDGSVGDQRVLSPSGNVAFDIAALGAAECGGKGRFGPLPDDLPFDRFPIRFQFKPGGGDAPPLPQVDDAR